MTILQKDKLLTFLGTLVLGGIIFIALLNILQSSPDESRESMTVGEIVTEQTLLGLTDEDTINLEYSSDNENYNLELEVAQSGSKQASGLMHRTELDGIDGMIFISHKSSAKTFWMKDTLIPLDIIYINNAFEIVKVHQNTKPDQTEEVYPSEKPVQYVIELEGGRAEQFGLVEGEKIIINSIEKR